MSKTLISKPTPTFYKNPDSHPLSHHTIVIKSKSKPTKKKIKEIPKKFPNVSDESNLSRESELQDLVGGDPEERSCGNGGSGGAGDEEREERVVRGAEGERNGDGGGDQGGI